jgi:hypothetical protein
VKAALGRNYKSYIRTAWMNGNYAYEGLGEWDGQLQSIRNTFGPSWLVKAQPRESDLNPVPVPENTRPICVGMSYKFVYPNYGTPDSHPDYTAHSGYVVKVEHQLTDKECDPESGPAYWVHAADGWCGNAHASELHPTDLVTVGPVSAPMVKIPPATPITPKDRLVTAMTELDTVVQQLDGGRVGNSVIWASVHAAQRSISEAMSKL